MQLFESINNLRVILSIELLSACQAIDFRKGLKPAKILNILHKLVRKNIAFLDKDRLLKNDLDLLLELINQNYLLNKLDKHISII